MVTAVSGAAPGTVRLSERAGRWVVAVTALGAGLVLLETTVVNVALPSLGRSLDVPLAGLQWTVTAFTLTLSGFILLGGALGDRFGRRRAYLVGMVWFAAASLLCGLAPSLGWLLAGRALQGVGGALLVPGSLALIQASLHPDDRARAVGVWSGLSGVAGASGPLLGGWLVGLAGWRWVFLVNVPVAAVLAALLVRYVPESRAATAQRRFDLPGALLAALGLGGVTYALVEADGGAVAAAAGAGGLAALAGFLLVERRAAEPMLPLELFGSRLFSAANLVSFCLYGAVAWAFFLLPIRLQVTVGYSAFGAGLALVPATVLLLALSARAGALTARIGPRRPAAAGSLACAAGLLLAIRIGPHASYPFDVLPAVGLLGLGISLITAPISAAVLGAVPDHRAGIASGVNNGVARVAGLLVVAALPPVTGLPDDAARNPAALDHGYALSMSICAGLFVLGGLISWFAIPRPARQPTPACRRHCTLPGPPLEPAASRR